MYVLLQSQNSELLSSVQQSIHLNGCQFQKVNSFVLVELYNPSLLK